MPAEPLRGLLNVHKPSGPSSRDVVNRVVRLVRPAKAGHAGTLDPLASGVLVVGVGAATRLVSLVQELPKTYRATFRLGATSDTDDVEGTIVERPDARPVASDDIEALLPEFRGRIAQVPPQFSAVHVKGERAYRLARRGESVEIEPRDVDVHRLELLSLRYPLCEVEIECGSGTYVRSIGRDLGQRLGCGAIMTELVRTSIGPFTLADALPLDELTPQTLRERLLPAAVAVAHLPQLRLTEAEARVVGHGRSVVTQAALSDGATVALLSPAGELAALAQFSAADGTLAPKLVLG